MKTTWKRRMKGTENKQLIKNTRNDIRERPKKKPRKRYKKMRKTACSLNNKGASKTQIQPTEKEAEKENKKTERTQHA